MAHKISIDEAQILEAEGVAEASKSLATEYGLAGIFILFLIICIVLMGWFIKRLIDQFLARTDKFTDVIVSIQSKEAEQSVILGDMKGILINLNEARLKSESP